MSKIASEIQYRAIKGLLWLVRVIPYRIAIAVGRFFGILAWILVPFHRKIVDVQMKYALGNAYHKSLSINVFMNVCMHIVDMVKFLYMSGDEHKIKIVINGLENFEAARATGRGIMFISCHLGNWEMLGHVPKLVGIELGVMANVRDDPKMESIIKGFRLNYTGMHILPPKGGMVLKLSEELKAGRHVGITVDQRGRRENRLFCDVFGMPAPTSPAPALIALRGDAIIVPVCAVDKGDFYEVCVEKPVDSRDFGKVDESIQKLCDCYKSDAIQKLSDYMQKWVESVVREYPDQWFWLHNRWIRRPDMKKVLRGGLDFREYVQAQAERLKKA
jgi:KDO2-lipid IV(A) lauroyltransferase